MEVAAIDVALAIVVRDGRILVLRRRSRDELDGLWEFPGGKIEPGETPEAAASRECAEETGVRVRPVGRIGPSVPYRYAHATVRLIAVRCEPEEREKASDEESARVGSVPDEVRWIPAEKVRSLPMPPANGAILEALLDGRGGGDFGET